MSEESTTPLETVEFAITLSALWHNDPPKYEVLIDDTIFDHGVVEEMDEQQQIKIVRFSTELPEGDHTLKIRLLGKQFKHTIIDAEGNILKDQLLHVKQIEIDDIELDNVVWTHGFFHKQIGMGTKNLVFNETPEKHKYITTGFNGEYRLTFSVPTYMWFLENL
jgi:hypothetical protein